MIVVNWSSPNAMSRSIVVTCRIQSQAKQFTRKVSYICTLSIVRKAMLVANLFYKLPLHNGVTTLMRYQQKPHTNDTTVLRVARQVCIVSQIVLFKLPGL